MLTKYENSYVSRHRKFHRYVILLLLCTFRLGMETAEHLEHQKSALKFFKADGELFAAGQPFSHQPSELSNTSVASKQRLNQANIPLTTFDPVPFQFSASIKKLKKNERQQMSEQIIISILRPQPHTGKHENSQLIITTNTGKKKNS